MWLSHHTALWYTPPVPVLLKLNWLQDYVLLSLETALSMSLASGSHCLMVILHLEFSSSNSSYTSHQGKNKQVLNISFLSSKSFNSSLLPTEWSSKLSLLFKALVASLPLYHLSLHMISRKNHIPYFMYMLDFCDLVHYNSSPYSFTASLSHSTHSSSKSNSLLPPAWVSPLCQLQENSSLSLPSISSFIYGVCYFILCISRIFFLSSSYRLQLAWNTLGI